MVVVEGGGGGGGCDVFLRQVTKFDIFVFNFLDFLDVSWQGK